MLEEVRMDPTQESSGMAWPYRHLDLELVVFRTVKEYKFLLS